MILHRRGLLSTVPGSRGSRSARQLVGLHVVDARSLVVDRRSSLAARGYVVSGSAP
jgi:hypothetical protein